MAWGPSRQLSTGLWNCFVGRWRRKVTDAVVVGIATADQHGVADQIYAVASIKWKDDHPFDDRDFGDLLAQRGQVPVLTDRRP